MSLSSDEARTDHLLRTVTAWAVHVYTALGIPLALYSGWALFEGNVRGYFLALCTACFIDATDGFLARRVGVKQAIPWFDGGRMDDLIDFVHYAFLPALAMPLLGLLTAPLAWCAVIPVMASGYGFCQDTAKTDDSFIGFPSYWNILVIYLFFFGLSAVLNLVIIIALSILVFVPIHYVYPSRTPFLRPFNLLLGVVWGVLLVIACYAPESAQARPLVMISLFYPVYYVVVTGFHHWRVTRPAGVSR